uniref:Uncharacterized protein n=1 Tax=Romanomermis culicivorax TaxID=13658 RepID=A0A915I455_ROMCU
MEKVRPSTAAVQSSSSSPNDTNSNNLLDVEGLQFNITVLPEQSKDVLMPARRTFPPLRCNYQGAPEEPQLQPQPQQWLQQYETPHELLLCAGDQ